VWKRSREGLTGGVKEQIVLEKHPSGERRTLDKKGGSEKKVYRLKGGKGSGSKRGTEG